MDGTVVVLLKYESNNVMKWLKVIFSRCMEVAAIPERERERERVRERIGVEMKSRSF